jgi:hypothetical protein
MPSYNQKEFKESNVNYLNKDFTSFKKSLIDYAKAYFPDTYRDFNETSPGMMLLEMTSYVGDVMSFYIDQQYREMMLPLAEERRNIINLAKMFGYKVKPIVPAYVDLTFQMDVDSVTGDEGKVEYSTANAYGEGIRVTSNADKSVQFETLEVVDFTVSQSNDTNDIASQDESTGLISSYTLSRKTRAVSGKTVTKTFNIKTPSKFLKLTIPDVNVIDIMSVIDSNGNNWYEVEFLAQDKVPITTHYSQDPFRDNAYYNLNGEPFVSEVAVPYALTYIETNKRFVRETNDDNTTSIVFGNGILKDGKTIDEGFLDLEQLGIIIPGQSGDLDTSIDPLLGDEYSTLGETPLHTTLTVTYRVGGGISSNVSAGDLTEIVSSTVSTVGGSTVTDLTVSNKTAAIGGRDEETTEEIKEKTKAFFTTQNRCVTKEDYEARVLNIPSKFGSIAKVYVTRNTLPTAGEVLEIYQNLFDENFNPVIHDFDNIVTSFSGVQSNVQNNYQNLINAREALNNHIETLVANFLAGDGMDVYDFTTLAQLSGNLGNVVEETGTSVDGVVEIGNNINQGVDDLVNLGGLQIQNLDLNFGSISVYILANNRIKNLVGNPNAGLVGVDDNVPLILKHNVQNYLNNYRLLTDDVMFLDGYIINFGVFFDVVAQKHANKSEVNLLCIQKIIDFFRVEKMQFSQPIFISQLEFELMGIDGVRSVNYVTITQEENYNSDGLELLDNKTFTYSINSDGTLNTDGTSGYGYAYDFQAATVNKVILPPSPTNPGVFELKNPKTNIKGVVR